MTKHFSPRSNKIGGCSIQAGFERKEISDGCDCKEYLPIESNYALNIQETTLTRISTVPAVRFSFRSLTLLAN